VRRLDAAFDGAARRTDLSPPASFNSRVFFGRLSFNLNDLQNEGRREAQRGAKTDEEMAHSFLRFLSLFAATVLFNLLQSGSFTMRFSQSRNAHGFRYMTWRNEERRFRVWHSL
jgi:hypothetical protein